MPTALEAPVALAYVVRPPTSIKAPWPMRRAIPLQSPSPSPATPCTSPSPSRRGRKDRRAGVVTQQELNDALALERTLSDLVNQAYHLTPDEVKLLWVTAPPRMPFLGP